MTVDKTAVISNMARVHKSVQIGPFVVIHDGAVIDAGTKLLAHCSVGPNAYVGANCILHPQVTVCAKAEIEDNCILQPYTLVMEGAVLGEETETAPRATIRRKSILTERPRELNNEVSLFQGIPAENQNMTLEAARKQAALEADEEVEEAVFEKPKIKGGLFDI